MDASLFYSVDSSMHPTPLSRLRLDGAEITLCSVGVSTLGDLLSRMEITPGFLNKLRCLSHEHVLCVRHRLNALTHALDIDGTVDWMLFDEMVGPAPPVSNSGETQDRHVELACSIDGTPLLPSAIVASAQEFFDSIGEVIAGLLDIKKSALDQCILTERILQSPGSQATLESLAAASVPMVTRERVRQREAKMLSLFSNAFMGESDRRFRGRVRPSFITYWKKAAEQLSHAPEFTIYEFVDQLSDAWQCGHEDILRNLPLILSVLTTTAALPFELKEQVCGGRELFAPVPEMARGVALRTIPCGISVDHLAVYGLETSEDLWHCLRTGRAPASTTALGRKLRQLARALHSASTSDGERFDWVAYRASMEIPDAPGLDVLDPSEFMLNLPEAVESLIHRIKLPPHALQIYRSRIAVDRRKRRTLQQVADDIGTYGPVVKRHESSILGTLNELLAEGSLCAFDLCIHESFMSNWAVASTFFAQSEGDYHQFVSGLSREWNLEGRYRPESFEVLWAVLSQYPGGRPRRSVCTPVPAPRASSASASAVIKLRGFRATH